MPYQLTIVYLKDIKPVDISDILFDPLMRTSIMYYGIDVTIDNYLNAPC